MSELTKAKVGGVPLLYILILGLLIMPGSWIPGSTSTQRVYEDLLDMFTGATAVPAGPSGVYYGNIQFIINRNDYLASGAVTPTSDSYTLYHMQPYQGASGIAITASGTTTEVPPEDNGIVYMVLYGGTDFYIVEDAFLQANKRVIDSYWSDFDNDGDDDFVCKLDVSKVGTPEQQQTPTFTLSLPLLDEDVASFSDDNPSDQTGIGETEVVKPITWKVSGITSNDGAFLTRLYFATNDTRGGDDVRFEECTLSGGWVDGTGSVSYFGSPVKEENGNYEAWYLNPPDYLEYHNGIRLWVDSNDADALYITVNVRCTFETNDTVAVTLYADFLDPDGSSVTQVTDLVNLDEA
jgi:hypothetical protein